MNNGTVRSMTLGQAKELAVTLAQSALTDLSYEQATCLLTGNNRTALVEESRAMQRRLVGLEDGQKTTSVSTHQNIDHKWTMGDIEWRGLGFLHEHEDGAYQATAIKRVEARLEEGWKIVDTKAIWKKALSDSKKFPPQLTRSLLTNFQLPYYIEGCLGQIYFVGDCCSGHYYRRKGVVHPNDLCAKIYLVLCYRIVS